MNRTPTERPPSTGDERGVLPPTRMECAERVEGPHHMEAVMGPDDYVICRNTKATDAHEAARDLDNQVGPKVTTEGPHSRLGDQGIRSSRRDCAQLCLVPNRWHGTLTGARVSAPVFCGRQSHETPRASLTGGGTRAARWWCARLTTDYTRSLSNSQAAAACHCSGAGRSGWGGMASRVINRGVASGYSAAADTRARTSRSRVAASERPAHT